MPWLFSYGTLQDPAVQLTQLGRRLDGHADALPGFTRGRVAVDDEGRAAGLSHYENAVPSPRTGDRVAGYMRHEVTLASGTRAWVYVASGH